MEQIFSSGFASTLADATQVGQMSAQAAFLPLLADSGLGPDDFRWWHDVAPMTEDCRYHNAATCPDCGTGMVRLGNCYSCPGCGWGSCGS